MHGAGQREWVRTVALRRASAEPEGDHVSRTLGLCTMVTVVGGHTEVKYREINKITVKEEII